MVDYYPLFEFPCDYMLYHRLKSLTLRMYNAAKLKMFIMIIIINVSIKAS